MAGLVVPDEPSDAVRRAFSGNCEAAGRFWPSALSFVGHYALTWLPPHSLR